MADGLPGQGPTAGRMLLTPIAPHMLTNRPLVVTGTSTASVEPVMKGNDEVFVVFGGQSGHALPADDVVVEAAKRSGETAGA